jgi:aminoglycoside 3-N-acetyltransferase
VVSEADVIAATPTPGTVTSLTADLRTSGIEPGCVVIVHSSLSAIGWVAGGAQAVVEALLAAVGPEGTVVMATQSGHLTDPGHWENPPVPAEWVPIIRDAMPAYDPQLTPTRGVGQVVECFRGHPEARRSPHPTLSFAAVGPHAEAIAAEQPLAPSLGDPSPLGRLYELDALVLLIGVDHDANTSLHLAEHRAEIPGAPVQVEGVAMTVDGERRWVQYQDLAHDTDDFVALGVDFAATGGERRGRVGQADTRLCRQRALVDFAVPWLRAHRPSVE